MPDPDRKGGSLQQAVAITTLSPVLDGRLGALQRKLDKVRTIPLLGRPLQALAFIHFARWTPITRLHAPEGPIELKSAYLLFESTFDGGLGDYLNAFADRLPVRLAALWGECEEFEETVDGAADGRLFPAGAFKRYVARNELAVLHFAGAYSDATTQMVRQAIALAGPPTVPERERAQVALGPVPPERPWLDRAQTELSGWWRSVRRDYDPGPLTLALPIDPDRSSELVQRITELPQQDSPLAAVPGTHFARFVLMPRTLGLPGKPRDELPGPYLLFTSNHDGSGDEYLAQLAAAPDLGWIWEGCRGCPADAAAVAGWLASHAIDTSYFVIGYPPRSVGAIRAALQARSDTARTLVAAAATGAPTRIPATDVQGNVLRAYGVAFPCAGYLLFTVEPERREDARAIVAHWSRQIAYGGPAPVEQTDSRGARARLNLAFTHAGLEALGVPDDWLEQLPQDFKDGAAARSPELGDRGDSAVANWEFGRSPGHVLLIVHASSEAWRNEVIERLRDEAGDALALVHDQRAALLARVDDEVLDNRRVPSCGDVYSREHFGFADGCSQPAIAGEHDDFGGSGVLATIPARSGTEGILQAWGWVKPKRRWRGVAAGEFVLGFDNEDGDLPQGSGSPLGPNATFMVYRKLEQHVQRFREHTERSARELGLDVDELRARIVGRFADGTPLALSQRADSDISLDRARANAFSYRDDPTGAGCPLGAHVRRTNPRAGLPAGGEATMRHRIIRRGLPYGRPFEADPDGSRGLMFVCYCACIENGFETIQREWCGHGFPLGLGEEPDYLLQQPNGDGKLSGGMTISLEPLRVLKPPEEPFVTVRGTEYLLLPGRAGLEALAGLAEDGS
jgi:Dyp-type peroxidase family